MKKLLYTFFFGYAAFKWRRLVRTLIIIPTFFVIVIWLFNAIESSTGRWKGNNYNNGYDESFSILEYFGYIINGIGMLIGIYIVIGLISWLIKPFIIKEN